MVPSEDIEGHVFESVKLTEHRKTLGEFEGADYVRVLTKATLDSGEGWRRMCMRWRRGKRGVKQEFGLTRRSPSASTRDQRQL
ncbi:hypothetical protein CKCBHOJB_01803 [Thauera sp. GDN1]|nr:hypothetical protein CKCBHOJB_01803 [Thauera sp. GDN1]